MIYSHVGLKGVTVASKEELKIQALEPGTYEEYQLDENECARFVKKERFHSIGNFPKYDVNVTRTGKTSRLNALIFVGIVLYTIPLIR